MFLRKYKKSSESWHYEAPGNTLSSHELYLSIWVGSNDIT